MSIVLKPSSLRVKDDNGNWLPTNYLSDPIGYTESVETRRKMEIFMRQMTTEHADNYEGVKGPLTIPPREEPAGIYNFMATFLPSQTGDGDPSPTNIRDFAAPGSVRITKVAGNYLDFETLIPGCTIGTDGSVIIPSNLQASGSYLSVYVTNFDHPINVRFKASNFYTNETPTTSSLADCNYGLEFIYDGVVKQTYDFNLNVGTEIEVVGITQVRFTYTKALGVSATLKDPMLVIDHYSPDYDIYYSPYTKTTYDFTIPSNLGVIGGEIDLLTGDIYNETVRHRFDGTEDVIYYGSNVFIYNVSYDDGANASWMDDFKEITVDWPFTTWKPVSLSNAYRPIGTVSAVSDLTNRNNVVASCTSNIRVTINTEEDGVPMTRTVTLRNYSIIIKDTRFSSESAFKAYLAEQFANGTPVEILALNSARKEIVGKVSVIDSSLFENPNTGINYYVACPEDACSVDSFLPMTMSYVWYEPKS